MFIEVRGGWIGRRLSASDRTSGDVWWIRRRPGSSARSYLVQLGIAALWSQCFYGCLAFRRDSAGCVSWLFPDHALFPVGITDAISISVYMRSIRTESWNIIYNRYLFFDFTVLSSNAGSLQYWKLRMQLEDIYDTIYKDIVHPIHDI